MPSPQPYRRLAYYVDRVLRGEKPAELSIERPTVFEFLINLKTAKSLGIELQPALIARADRVIDEQFVASKCVAALLDCQSIPGDIHEAA